MKIEATVSESTASPSPRSDNQCATPTRRLESFQQMMLRWEQIRPYNAVHAVELSGLSLTADRLSESVNAVLRSVGISDAVFDAALKNATYGSQPRFVPVSEAVLPQPDWTALSDLMTAKLTESYQQNDDTSPFRILLVHSSDGRQYLIIGYRHAIADNQLLGIVAERDT